MHGAPTDILTKITEWLLPGELLRLSRTCRHIHQHTKPDVSHACLLLTDAHSHPLFKKTARGYIDHAFPFPENRTMDQKRRIIDTVVQSNDPLSEMDVYLLTAALADPHAPRVIPWNLLWYHDKKLLKFACLRCCVPLFNRVERAITSQADSNMAQLLLISGITGSTTEHFVEIMRRQTYEILQWTVDIAERFGYDEVVVELRDLKRRRTNFF